MFLKHKKDNSDSIDAIKKAIEVLRNFYQSTPGLLQTTPVEPPEFKPSKTQQGNLAIEFLETAETSF